MLVVKVPRAEKSSFCLIVIGEDYCLEALGAQMPPRMDIAEELERIAERLRTEPS